jgi:hypothetical protein
MSAQPFYSFVATSRNDDHGGDVLRRTQTFINRLAEQCIRHQVSAELVLVDWNPPRSRAPLADVLGWPAGSEWFSARVITVPHGLHRTLRYSSRLAMFQMIAKNVGIRRARGAYSIATNIDIIFSDELFRWLKAGVAQEGVLYRSDRWDIPNEIQLEGDIDALLRRAHREAIRRNLRDGTHVVRDGVFVNLSGNRFDETFYAPVHQLASELNDALQASSFAADRSLRLANDLLSALPTRRRDFLVPVLHTNACGDFTMLAAADWERLRGYPEWQIFSWHIDSILLYQAFYAGLAVEEIGSACVHYHIEHDYGSGWTPEGADRLWSRLLARGIPFVTYERFNEIVAELREAHEAGPAKLYNGLDWGFAEHDVEVREIVATDSSRRAPRAENTAPLDEDLSPKLAPAGVGNLLPFARPVGERPLVEQRVGDGGEPDLVVETAAKTWVYAVEFDRVHLPDLGEFWIRATAVVEHGNIALGVHDRTDRRFVAEVSAGASPQLQELLVHIPEFADAGKLIIRNVTEGDRPARFRLRAVEVLRDATSPAGTAIADANGRPPAIVRELGDDANQQRLIILPPAAEAAIRLDDLDVATGANSVLLHLHVIEGEALIELRACGSGEPLARHSQGPSAPFLRVDFAAPGRAPHSVAFRNPVPFSRTVLLLHRLELQG